MADRDGLTAIDIEEFYAGQQRTTGFAYGFLHLGSRHLFRDHKSQVLHNRRVVADRLHRMDAPAWLDQWINAYFSRVDACSTGHIEADLHLGMKFAQDALHLSVNFELRA